MKNNRSTMILIKTVHTVIWIVMVWAILYIVYAGLRGIFNSTLYLALGLVLIEMFFLLIYRWTCPLTIIAKRINPNWEEGDDIYLPVWLAMNNKTIFGTLLSIGIILVILRLLFRLF